MIRKRIVSLFFLALFCIMILSSCTFEREENKDFTVGTSFYPVYVFTKNITEGAENVRILCMSDYSAGCLHDYQMLPADIKMIETSDLFIINGGGMEDVIEKALKNSDEINITDSSSGVEFIHTGHSHDGHEEINSHIWMYVPNAIIQVKNITDALIKYNPENEEIYKTNSIRYIEKLEEIHSKYEKELKDKGTLNIVTGDETFEYLAKGYDFNIVGKVLSGHNEQASAGKLKELIKEIEEKGVIGIFAEKNSDEPVLKTLSEETSCPLYYLNSTIKGDGKYKGVYENNMLENLEILIKAIEIK